MPKGMREELKEKPTLKKRSSMTGIELKKGNAASTGSGVPEVDTLGWLKFLLPFLLQYVLVSAVGAAIAWYVYEKGNTALYDRNILRLAETEQGYTLLAAAAFNLAVYWVNNFPMFYKTMIMRFTSGNLRANMQIYKQYSPDSATADAAGYVLLETHGPVGAYNRANRSLTHFVENSIPMALFIVLVGQVFPLPTLCLTAVFGAGRALHQVGYAAIGYGAHGPGFLAATMAQSVLQGLALLAADKSLGLGAFASASASAAPYVASAAPYVAGAFEATSPYVAAASEGLSIYVGVAFEAVAGLAAAAGLSMPLSAAGGAGKAEL